MKNRLSTLSITILSLVFVIHLKAQEPATTSSKIQTGNVKFLKLSGIVKSYEGDPIKGAVILIPEIGKSSESDGTGAFEFLAIPPGKYHLEVFADGYMDFISDVFGLEGSKKTFKITLLKKLSEEIVVTATRTKKLYAEVPVRTEVITARDIEQMQASQLAEALALTTGVRVESNCQNCNFTQVRINGMEGKYSQILIDNSPIFSSMIGVYGLEQIPAEMLNRIEVVKGGGSALYGGSAVAGVINVLTKEPMENGTWLKLHQEFTLGEPSTNFGFRSSLVSKDQNTKAFLFANYKNRQPVDISGDDMSEIGKMRSTSFGVNFFRTFSEIGGKLKLSFFRITEDRRGGNKFDLPPHEADIAEAIDSDLNSLSADWNHYITRRLYYNLSASYVDADRKSYYGSGQDPNAYGTTKNPVLFLNGQMNYQTGGHVISTGLQYKGEKIKDEALGYGRVINDHYRELGFFLQDDIKFNKTFFLLAGLRISKHSLIENYIFNPRMSLLVNLVKDLSWRTSVSTGFRAPQVFDEDLHITQVGGEGTIIENSPDLKEESSYSLSTGLDYGREFGNNTLQLSIEGFYTLLKDTFVLQKKEFDPRENALVFERINGSNARVYGVSVDLGYRIGLAFSLNTGWTFQRSLLDEPEPDFGSNEFFRTPDSYGYVSLHYENERIVDADISLEYTGNMKVPHYAGYIEEDRLETTETFLVLNAKLTRSIALTQNNKLGLFVGIFNIIDSYQKDLDQGIFRDAGYIYGPTKPRSYYAGFEFSF
ncbi:MAG: TonB-dependent receptor [Candidatus Aminicenantes bacterium]|nr:TonB-dependent receptor [Candidatus Aminicenantes bacterium]